MNNAANALHAEIIACEESLANAKRWLAIYRSCGYGATLVPSYVGKVDAESKRLANLYETWNRMEEA